jgi:hypothetical protein
VNLKLIASVIVDESQFPESVHEEIDSRAGRAHHLCQSLLTVWEGVPLRMHRMNPECLASDPSGLSVVVTILLREEPDEDEEEEEDDRKEEDDDNGAEGYSE